VRRFFYYVKSLGLKGIIEIIPSFRSCLIQFDGENLSFDYLASLLAEREGEMNGASVPDPVRHEIAVRYGGNYGPDMEFICEYSGLTEADVIEAHSSAVRLCRGLHAGIPLYGHPG
jgi:inhibitor of KinA